MVAVGLTQLNREQDHDTDCQEVHGAVVGSREHRCQNSQPGHAGQVGQAEVAGRGVTYDVGEQRTEGADDDDRQQVCEGILDGRQVPLGLHEAGHIQKAIHD